MSLFSPEVLLEESSGFFYSPYWTNPLSAFIDIIRAGLRVLQDGSNDYIDINELLSRGQSLRYPQKSPGLIKRFIQRFLLGLPMVGAGSLVHMLFSIGLLGPIQWLARFRGGRNRRDRRNTSAMDTAALLIVTLVVIGTLRWAISKRVLFVSLLMVHSHRAIYKVYQLTERLVKQLLLRAEDSILEVN